MLTEVLNIFQARLAEAKLPVYVHNESIFSSEVHSNCLCQNQRGGQTRLEWGSGLLLLPRPTPSIGDNKMPPQKYKPRSFPTVGASGQIPFIPSSQGSQMPPFPQGTFLVHSPQVHSLGGGCLCETPERAPILPMGWGLGCGLFFLKEL